MMGISPQRFRQSKLLNNFYRIVSYNDRKGKEFVSTESKLYPFYGVQWHPKEIYTKCVIFQNFCREVRKNKHS